MSAAGAFSFLQVVLGVGFLIFFHELGHFVAARLAGVRVHALSLGFGPRLFGWRRGATDYRVSLFPLGGYVRLAGEVGGEERSGAPDELASKGVGVRAAIFAAGVVANALFAFLLFPILFRIGVPFFPPVVGDVLPGGPAWKAGIQPGTRVLEIEDRPLYAFEQVGSYVAIADPGPLRLLVETPAGERKTVTVEAEYDPESGHRHLHVLPPLDPEGTLEVDPAGPAWEAGLRSGDRLVEVAGSDEANRERALREALRSEQPVELVVEREGERLRLVVVPRARTDSGTRLLGIHPIGNVVRVVRAEAEVAGWRAGDRVLEVGGRPVHDGAEFARALRETTPPSAVALDRSGTRIEKRIETPAEATRLLASVVLGQDLDSNRVVPMPRRAAEAAGVRPGDAVLAVALGPDFPPSPGANGDLPPAWKPVRAWEDLAGAIRQAGSSPVRLLVERGAEGRVEIEVTPAPAVAFAYGIALRPASYVYRTDNLLDAVVVGWRCSIDLVREFGLAIERMVKREMSPKTLVGIVSIVGFSVQFRRVGVTKLLFFLGLLSINLALINLLPIPILDGGQLFFLLVEKLKGSPVSEKALTVAQVAGLLVIAGLVLFVTWNDLRRWIPGFPF